MIKMEFSCTQVDGLQIKSWLNNDLALNSEDYYLTFQGKLVHSDTFIDFGTIHVHPTVKGGKGGFGSMLRAIGAQIEKTTNREACRDLSGRRLRDINEEKRLKNWIDKQAEREKEAKERKQKKLERLCELPKHEFKDEKYNEERSLLPEVVEDAVIQGLQASASCSGKRKLTNKEELVKKKKPKLWVDDDFDEDISDEDLSDTEVNRKKSEEDTSKPESTPSETNSNQASRTQSDIVQKK